MKRVVFCAAVLAAACGGPASPLAPAQPAQTGASTTTPNPTSPSAALPNVRTGSYTISGFVSEAGRPVAGANVNAWVDQGDFGYSYMWARGAVLTGADGSFRLTNLPAGVKVWPDTYKTGYVQQCAASQLTIDADAVVDMELVARANVSTSVAPSKPGLRSVSGTIYGTTASGTQPLAGAFVDFEPVDDYVMASTYSDSSGGYTLCGIPDGQQVTIGAGMNGKAAYTSAKAGQTSGVDITLP